MARCNDLCTKDATGYCAVCAALAERARFERPLWAVVAACNSGLRWLRTHATRAFLPIGSLKRNEAMTEATLSTALSTLAQVSASLAALIGFLGLWKLDRLQRAMDSQATDLIELTSRATGVNPPWVMVLESARKIASTPTIDLPEGYQRSLQPYIQRALDRLQTLPSEVFWLKTALVVFLCLAMGVFLFAFFSLVNISTSPHRASFRHYIFGASVLLAVGTFYMVYAMAK
jgi:hypothetical protein